MNLPGGSEREDESAGDEDGAERRSLRESKGKALREFSGRQKKGAVNVGV